MTPIKPCDESQMVPFRRYAMLVPGAAAGDAECGMRELTADEARLRGAVRTRRVFYVAMA